MTCPCGSALLVFCRTHGPARFALSWCAFLKVTVHFPSLFWCCLMLQLDMDWWLECVLFSPRHFASSSLMKQKHSEQEVWYPFLWFWQPGMWFLASYSYWVILPCLLTSQDGCGRCLSRFSCGVVSRSGGNFHSTANLRSAVIWALQCRPCHRNSATAQRGMVNRFDRCCQLLILRCQSDLLSFSEILHLHRYPTIKKAGYEFPPFCINHDAIPLSSPIGLSCN